ncbi:hypothetical protein [Nocardiopsis gilva]
MGVAQRCQQDERAQRIALVEQGLGVAQTPHLLGQFAAPVTYSSVVW